MPTVRNVSYEPTESALAGRLLFGENLRRLRTERGLTQETLALRANLDRSFLADLEATRHSCTIDRLFDIAAALEVEPSELLAQPA